MLSIARRFVPGLKAMLSGRQFFTVVQPHERVMKIRLGNYVSTSGAGVRLYVPFLEKMLRFDMRSQVHSLKEQEIISKDNVSFKIDSEIQWRIVDPYKAMFNVQWFTDSTITRGQLALRDVLSTFDVDDFLQQRSQVADLVLEQLQDVKEQWGIEVELVRVKNIILDPDIKRAMARKAEAVKNSEAKVINAEADVRTAEQYARAAEIYKEDPVTLRLREFQLWHNVSKEPNNTIFVVPSNIVDTVGALAKVKNSA